MGPTAGGRITDSTIGRAASPKELLGHLPVEFRHLTPVEQRVSLALYRLLADAEPVTPERLAQSVAMPRHEIAEMLRRWPGVYLNDRGGVIGYWGLALHPMAHRFEVNGRTLYTWCAWDSLFLPALLGATARVVSTCPVTRDRITLTVTRDGVTQAVPPGVVLSFPQCDSSRMREDLISNFCHYVFFFSSFEAGGRWVADHPGTVLVSLAEAFELGRQKNAGQYPDILYA